MRLPNNYVPSESGLSVMTKPADFGREALMQILAYKRKKEEEEALGPKTFAAGSILKGAPAGMNLTRPESFQALMELNKPTAKGKGAAGSGNLSPKDMDAISRIEQGLTNLKQVEQQYKTKGAGSHGVYGAVTQLPILGNMLKTNPQFQNANTDATAYDRSINEAKNSYSRATFGRVSNDILKHSLELFPPAGSSKENAANSLNELANTLQGVANGVVSEKRGQGDEEGAQALESRFNKMFGNMRFFPENDTGSTQPPPGPGMVHTNFRQPAGSSGNSMPPKAPSVEIAPEDLKMFQSVPPTDPRYPKVQQLLKSQGVLQ